VTTWEQRMSERAFRRRLIASAQREIDYEVAFAAALAPLHAAVEGDGWLNGHTPSPDWCVRGFTYTRVPGEVTIAEAVYRRACCGRTMPTPFILLCGADLPWPDFPFAEDDCPCCPALDALP
jgi:hypothetical protein